MERRKIGKICDAAWRIRMKELNLSRIEESKQKTLSQFQTELVEIRRDWGTQAALKRAAEESPEVRRTRAMVKRPHGERRQFLEDMGRALRISPETLKQCWREHREYVAQLNHDVSQSS